MDRKWTVMVYLAGDTADFLSAEMIFALKEMKEANEIGPNQPVTVLALFDPCAPEYKLERYVLNRSGSLDQDKDELPDKPSMKESLLEFIRWGTETYPADHCMVVFSGHASGPEGNCIMLDQDSPNALTLRDLHDIVSKTYGFLGNRRIDILGMSCCLANMVELCHELQAYPEEEAAGSYVDYLIGAEGYEPLTGWPYKQIFQSMAAKSGSSTREMAQDIVRQYTDYYAEFAKANVSAYIAAVDLARYEDLARSIAALSFALSREVTQSSALQNQIRLAHLRVQSYLYGKYADLCDFCEPLCDVPGEVGALCRDILQTIRSMVAASGRTGKRFEFSSGLGIYLPWTKVSAKYLELRFARDVRWHEFLNSEYSSRCRGNMVIGVVNEDTTSVRGGGDHKPSPCLLAIPG